MKRKRDQEELVVVVVPTEIRSAIDELSVILKTGVADTADDGTQTIDRRQHVPIKPFLALCNLLIQVLDKIGPTMVVLRQDIHQNIQRIESLHDSDPSTYWDMVEILKKEAVEGKAKKGPSCSKAFVWLTRSLDFTLALLQLLVMDFGRNLEHAVEEAYGVALKPWHGWISSTAYRVALKLVPDSETFVEILKLRDEDHDKLKEDMRNLISLLVPVLEHNKNIMRAYGLDKLKCI